MIDLEEEPTPEERRLEALRRLEILDTPPEVQFDDIVHLASAICETPIALLTLVDEDRQWFKAKIGLTISETSREVAFCNYTIGEQALLVVPDAARDARFSDNPLVTTDPNIRFYAGAPLRTHDGEAVGSLCVIDRVPRELSASQRDALTVLGRHASVQLELRRLVRELVDRDKKIGAQNDAIVRLQSQKDQLTGHLVHDLRAPLASIALNTDTLIAVTHDDDVRGIGSDIRAAAERMSAMVTDILRVGAADERGLALRNERTPLAKWFDEVRERFRPLAAEQRRVDVGVAPAVTLDIDRGLLLRVFENLVDNAFKYGARNVGISASVEPEGVDILVTDDGEGIAAEFRERVFDRYARLDSEARRQGRLGEGLGLTFCRMALEAHGGAIRAEAGPGGKGTTFRLRLPRAHGPSYRPSFTPS